MRIFKFISNDLVAAVDLYVILFLAGVGFVIGFLAGALRRWE